MTFIVRPVAPEDAPALTELLNAIIARGGTTALEDAFTPESLARTYLNGPAVYICLVAVDPTSERIEGFQTLGRYPNLPDDVGDIGTFARVDSTQRGVGSALFADMAIQARALGLSALNATIRGDNRGGLTFYDKHGFLNVGVTAGVPLKDGSLVDRVHKRFELIDITSQSDLTQTAALV